MADDKSNDMSLDNDDAGEIILKSNKDGTAVTIQRKYAMLSGVIKTALETDKSATEAPVDVTGALLQKVVEYLNQHKGVDPGIPDKPLRSKVMKEVVSDPWDAEFIDALAVERQKLYDVILAANYLDIKPLLHLGCAKIASLIKGVPVNKLKNILDPNYVESSEPPAATEEKKE